MEFVLENEKIRVRVSNHGGEMKSLFSKEENKEYLWQGDEAYWEDSAPNLFPYIARLTDGTYTYRGEEFHMSIHGFVKDMILKCKKTKDELVFELKANEETKKCYPFLFIYRIKYHLEHTSLVITYEVENVDDKSMYFGIGGHPGFSVPFIEETEFNDYYLEFEKNVQPTEIKLSDDCFILGEAPFEQLENDKLLLSHSLFDHDAIVLKNMGKEVFLRSNRDSKGIRVRFPDMEYLGLWHWPKTEVPYLCIEPWSSLPSKKDVIEDLEKQDNLICLDAGKTYSNTWSIELVL